MIVFDACCDNSSLPLLSIIAKPSLAIVFVKNAHYFHIGNICISDVVDACYLDFVDKNVGQSC